MKVSNDLRIKENIAYNEYLDMVEKIVALSFTKDSDGNYVEYVPHYCTTLLPTIIVDYCIDGVELDEDEKSDVVKYIEAIRNNDELSSLVDDILTGISYVRDETAKYFYNAIDDSDKIIKFELRKLSPSNKFLITLDELIKNLNIVFKDVDINEFLKNMERLYNSENKD